MYDIKAFLLRYFYPIHGSFLLIPTLSLIAGIWWYAAGCEIVLFIIFLLVCMLLLFIFGNIRGGIFSIMFFILGSLLTHNRYQNFEVFSKRYHGNTCNIQGIITDISPLYNTRYKFCTTIHVINIKKT